MISGARLQHSTRPISRSTAGVLEADCLGVAPGAIVLVCHECRASGRVTAAGGAAAGRSTGHGVDLGIRGRVEGLEAGNLHDLAPAAVLVAGHEGYLTIYRWGVVPPADRAVAPGCARHRQDLAGDAAIGVLLANAASGSRDARYLEGPSPTAVPLLGHANL